MEIYELIVSQICMYYWLGLGMIVSLDIVNILTTGENFYFDYPDFCLCMFL